MHLFFPSLFVPGDGEGQTLVMLTRIMLLQPIFLGGATVTIAILQARQHFILPALGQVIYTVSLICGIEATVIDNRIRAFSAATWESPDLPGVSLPERCCSSSYRFQG